MMKRELQIHASAVVLVVVLVALNQGGISHEAIVITMLAQILTRQLATP